MRILLPLCGVGLIIGFLLGIALYTDRANRAGVLGLSDSLLQSLRERVALQVAAYLEPASHAVLLGHSMLGRGAASEHAPASEAFAASILGQTPQVTNVLFADVAGNFLLVTRADPPATGTKAKQIRVTPAGRAIVWTSRDPDGAETERHEDPSDTYDARTRAWFTGAQHSDDVFWTSPYVFFTARAPGITASVHGPGQDPDVIGVDIRLDALSSFLRGLSIGRTGRAYIISRSGEMIAGPDVSRLLQSKDGQLEPAQVGAVGDADLVASWDHYRVQGVGTRVIEAGGRRLISIVTELGGKAMGGNEAGGDKAGGGVDAADAQGWLLAIIVPEADFSGFVQLNTERAGWLSIIVVGLAAGLGVLLVRQGLRSDRAERIVAERSEAVRIQGQAFAQMASELDLDETGAPRPGFSETLAGATGARRVSLWQWGAGGQSLRCQDSFEPGSAGHIAGLVLSRQEIPLVMDAIEATGELDVADARRDRRTASMHGLLMAPIGSTSLFVAPVRRAGGHEMLGLVTLEDARRDPAARDLVRAGATLLALRAPASSAPPIVKPGSPEAPAEAAILDGQHMDAALGPNGTALNPGEQACVLVLLLPSEALARVAPGGGAATLLGHRLACSAQAIGAKQGIPYIKMLGATIVAAIGPALDAKTSPADAAVRLAELTIALRECCAELFGDADEDAGFAFGLDVGQVLGGLLGPAPGVYNIWGDALDGARALAESAPAGSVQASEAVYRLLRQRFLFRPRGLFHRPGIGESRSYVLGGSA